MIGMGFRKFSDATCYNKQPVGQPIIHDADTIPVHECHLNDMVGNSVVDQRKLNIVPEYRDLQRKRC